MPFVQKPVQVYNSYKQITPSDFIPVSQQSGVAKVAAAIFVGTGGDLTLVGKDGVQATFKNVPSGTLLNVQAIYVKSVGTTASNIVALYGS